MQTPARARSVLLQLAVAALVAGAAAALAHNLAENMRLRGIRGGFDFLWAAAGFDISERYPFYDLNAPYWEAFLVGLLNTLKVSACAVALATAGGLLVGIARLAPNAVARGLASAYVEAFRNVPLLLQLFLWYLVFTQALPPSDQPLVLHGAIFLSKEGLAFPSLAWQGAAGLQLDLPRVDGLAITGGGTLSPEFTALLVALTCYTSAFIGEIVRAGILAVPKGQQEAAAAVGLSPTQRLWLVVLPQAARLVVPPLTSQYLNLVKNSSLAVAIGYPDLVSISNTALNQTGRAVECFTILMAVYLGLSLLTAAAMARFNARMALRSR